MPILYLHDKIYDTLKENELSVFLNICESKGISYLQIDDTSWQLLPELADITLVFCPLVTQPEFFSFIENLQAMLIRHGASVITESDLKFNPDMFAAVKAKIGIAFTESISSSVDCAMLFYYSLREKEKSLQFIGDLVKHLNESESGLSVDIASPWKHLTSYKYRRVIYSQAPAVLIELNNSLIPELKLNDIINCLTNNIINLYGSRPSPAQLDLLADCLAKVRKKSDTVTMTTASKSKSKSATVNNKKYVLSQPNRMVKSKPASRKRRFGKFSSVFPPADAPVNYFFKPDRPEYIPEYLQNYLESKNLSSQTITKSTFNRQISPAKEQITTESFDFTGLRGKENSNIEEKVTKDKSTLQNIKDLKRILE